MKRVAGRRSRPVEGSRGGTHPVTAAVVWFQCLLAGSVRCDFPPRPNQSRAPPTYTSPLPPSPTPMPSTCPAVTAPTPSWPTAAVPWLPGHKSRKNPRRRLRNNFLWNPGRPDDSPGRIHRFAVITAAAINGMAGIIGPPCALEVDAGAGGLAGELLERGIDVVAADPPRPTTTATASARHAATLKKRRRQRRKNNRRLRPHTGLARTQTLHQLGLPGLRPLPSRTAPDPRWRGRRRLHRQFRVPADHRRQIRPRRFPWRPTISQPPRPRSPLRQRAATTMTSPEQITPDEQLVKATAASPTPWHTCCSRSARAAPKLGS